MSYLTFDIASPPFDRWAGMRRLLSAVLRVADRTEPLTRRELRRESPVPAMLDQMPSGFSGHGVPLMFVALYLGILATLYRFRPVTEPGRRILPMLIVACPLLFAPAAYLLFGSLLFPTRANVVMFSVIEPFESGPYARLNLDVGIFSKQRRELRLAFDSPQPGFITNQREHRWGAATSYSVDDSAGRVVEIAAPRAYVLHMMQAEDIIPYDVESDRGAHR